MLRYIIRRLLQAIPTLLGISIISFALTTAVPGGRAAVCGFDPKMKPEACEKLIEQLGIDQNPVFRYLRWLTGFSLRPGNFVERLESDTNRCIYLSGINFTSCNSGGGVLRGDLGISRNTRQPVWTRLVEKMPATLELGITSLLLSLLIGVPLGVLSAVYRGSIFDTIVRSLTAIGQSIPIFWICLLLIVIFGIALRWLPTGGRCPINSLSDTCPFIDRIPHLILPSIALSIGGIAGFSRIMRTETLEVIGSDYIRTAKAKGVAPNAIWFFHAFRNSLIPLMTILGPAIVGVLGGALVAEIAFGWPGMAQMLVRSIGQKDFPMVLGSGMFFAALTIIGNLMSDIFYALVDPRVRFG